MKRILFHTWCCIFSFRFSTSFWKISVRYCVIIWYWDKSFKPKHIWFTSKKWHFLNVKLRMSNNFPWTSRRIIYVIQKTTLFSYTIDIRKEVSNFSASLLQFLYTISSWFLMGCTLKNIRYTTLGVPRVSSKIKYYFDNNCTSERVMTYQKKHFLRLVHKQCY